jgi:glycosyltransferase involved in cell wall biosynthesis
MRVLQVAYPFAPVGPSAVGGAEQVLSAIDAGLLERGHRSCVIACEGSQACGELFTVPLEAVSDDAARERAWASLREAIARLTARRPFDVVHLHGIDFHRYLPPAGPSLVTLHLPLAWYPPKAWRRRPGLVFNCVSAGQQRDATGPARMLPPIPNGVPVEALQARHAKRGYALMLGRICPEKGIHLGLDAARRAGVSCVVAGRVYPYPAHEAYFRDAVVPRLRGRARFIGPLGFVRKRRLLTAARCVLIPSIAPETASLVAMEAAACGTPAIAFASGALPETIEHGRTGFIVRDVEEMAEAIRRAEAIDPQTCRAIARARFSGDAMVERYISVYRMLASSHEAAA